MPALITPTVYKTHLISTIVDQIGVVSAIAVYKTHLISTIVDGISGDDVTACL